MSNPKSKSRPARWSDACSRASEALEELKDLQSEYQDWLDNLPDNLQSGTPLAEKLQSVTDLDLESAWDTVNEAESLDLPQGFGRD
jgi:hypothetical protein